VKENYYKLENCRDTVTLVSLGKSLGFAINPNILELLQIKLGDILEIGIEKILKKNVQKSLPIFMTRKVIRFGGTSKGFSIKKNIVDELQLHPGDVIGVRIKKFFDSSETA
jgi:hypothetical protein